MTRPGGRRPRRLHSLAAATLVAVLAVVLLAPARPVAAHADLESSTPAASDVLEQPPSALVLDFDEPVEAATADLALYDSSGAPLPVGEPSTGGDATVVTAAAPPLGEGTFAVVWRVTSEDGHVVDGAFSFQVGTASATDAAALVEQVRGGVQSPPVVRRVLGLARLVTYLGLGLLIGGGVLVAARRRTCALGEGTRTLFVLGGASGVGGATATFALYAATVVAGGFGDAARPSVWETALDTRPGRMLAIRIALAAVLAVLAVLLLRLARRDRALPSWWHGGAIAAAVAVSLTYPYAGHATTLRPAALWAVVAGVHTAGVLAWTGGLVHLVAGRPDDAAVRRFSRLATVAVPAIVVTGVAEALALADDLDDVTATSWGRVLLVKTSVVIVLLTLAAATRWLLQHQGAASIGRTVLAEAATGVLVLGLAAGLVALPPEAPEEAELFTAALTQAGVIADVTLTPGRVGANQVHVVVTPPGGALQPVAGVTGRMRLPSRDLPDAPISLAPEGADHWSGDITLPFSGDWTMELVVEVTPGATVLLSATVPVP